MKIRYSFDYQLEMLLSELSIEDLKTNGKDWPRILDLLYEGKIYPSQFVAIDATFNLMNKYAKIFADDLLFQDRLAIYRKLRSVTQFDDPGKIKTLVKTNLRHR